MYPSNKKKKVWREEKERLLKMTLEERRKEYIRDYVPLNTILSWKEEVKGKSQNDEENPQETSQVKKSLNEKVSLYRGDITLLEVDAIVNAANASLLGGGGVDGCIHRAAGPCLLAECRNLNGCDTGHAKITCGYDLPAKYVIHTVGPIARGHINGSHKEDLANCYKSSLKLVKENNIRSVAFPCISTGIYGFPNEPAAVIALSTIKEWLTKNHHEVDRIIFCVFLEVDFKIYKKKMSEFFPIDDNEEEDVDMKEDAEGLEPKGLSPPPKKSKAKKPECSKDSSEDENSPEEKQSAEEMEGQSQEAGGLRFLLRSLLGLIRRDGANAATVPSPASEEAIEVCKDEDSAKDENITKDNEVTNHSVCNQDHPNELSSNQEEATLVEQPEVIPLTDDQEEKEGEKAKVASRPKMEDTCSGRLCREKITAQGKDTPRVSVKREGSCDTENCTSPDVEMNSQADSVNDPTESQQED
ncbi:ADP-ribose glycohydrolase MACROD2 [Rhinolophus ferrumequinum]|uniref:ADP-ribose glycohydrolase MACROD2 n=1 Tax=Rhinolophus ferrumequinum TaxID=59479 RepID=UPI00140F85C1|nr:ADP-ribose glycohydrolase MACROD2 [Rhinolophus ferrumequinum]